MVTNLYTSSIINRYIFYMIMNEKFHLYIKEWNLYFHFTQIPPKDSKLILAWKK